MPWNGISGEACLLMLIFTTAGPSFLASAVKLGSPTKGAEGFSSTGFSGGTASVERSHPAINVKLPSSNSIPDKRSETIVFS